MKITAIETIVVNMPMKISGPAPLLGGKARTSIDTLLVRIDTDEGVSGWGEAFGHRIWPATRAAIDTLIGPQCIGRDPTAIGALMNDLQRNLHGVGRNGPAMYALSAIDIALWDIAGKLRRFAAVPPARRQHAARPAGLREPAALRRSPRRLHIIPRKRSPAAIGKSRCTKSKRRRSRRRAKRRVSAFHLMVDCNCPWTVERAIDMARQLEPYDLHWLEEPVWPPENHSGLADVRKRGQYRDRGR